MRKLGWGSTILVVGLIVATAIVPADAGGYVLSLNAPDVTINPGQQFQVNAVLTGANNTIDNMILDIGVAGPRPLIYNSYQLGGNVAFQTGSLDDFSVPKGALDTGVLAANPLITNALYPLTATRADVHIEAATRPGSTFTEGTIVNMLLTMPANALVNETFDFTAFPDTFSFLGETFFDANTSSPLRMTVVPEPVTLVLLGLGGVFAARRRFLGA